MFIVWIGAVTLKNNLCSEMWPVLFRGGETYKQINFYMTHHVLKTKFQSMTRTYAYY